MKIHKTLLPQYHSHKMQPRHEKKSDESISRCAIVQLTGYITPYYFIPLLYAIILHQLTKFVIIKNSVDWFELFV